MQKTSLGVQDGRRRLIGSLVHGSMANAMPQAIGAQVARLRCVS